MIRTCRNLKAHELIGLHASVIDSNNQSLVGSRGKILHETRNMLFLQSSENVKMIPKNIAKLELSLPSNELCVLDGKELVGRPEDRIRRLGRHD